MLLLVMALMVEQVQLAVRVGKVDLAVQVMAGPVRPDQLVEQLAMPAIFMPED
jgi:hypothetical protein